LLQAIAFREKLYDHMASQVDPDDELDYMDLDMENEEDNIDRLVKVGRRSTSSFPRRPSAIASNNNHLMTMIQRRALHL